MYCIRQLATIACALGLLACAGFAQEQEAAPDDVRLLEEEALNILQLIPGDQINLRVLDEGDVSGVYRIRDDGNILLPIINEVQLAKLTLPEATERLREALAEYIIAPQISLELAGRAPRRVYMHGEVGAKGILEWMPGLTLAKALNLSGGITQLGDMHRVKLKRGDEESVIDAEPLLLEGDFSTDVELEPEDQIAVPRRSRCFIIGPVPGAGDAYFEPDETLYQLLSRLGILTAKADLRSVRLVRREAELVVNLDVIRRTGDLESDIQLAHYDKIIISERGEVYLAGAVTGGMRDIRGAETAVRAILSTGGALPHAALDRCILVHDGEATQIDLAEAVLEGNLENDVELADGDLLIVPENKILVFGAVSNPGPLELPWPARLSEALAGVAGPLPNSDLRNVTILREGEPTTVDVRAFFEGGDIPEDIRLEPYDIVLVPEAWISVLGEVGSAGRIPYREAETMQELLATVGNPSRDADLTAVYLIRGNETTQLDITSLVREGDPAADMPLEPGDKVIIPEGLGRRIYITGQVGGGLGGGAGGGAISLRYEEAPDIARAIASVTGVLTGGGDITQTRILREGEVIMVDLHALYYENDLTQNIALEPGDTIWIPANEHGFIYVFGVAGTQQVPHFPGIRLTQVMARLGIPPDGASTNDLKLIRGSGEDREILTIPWGRIWQNTEDEDIRDPELERGDIILVREKGSDRRWRRFGDVVDRYFLFRSVIPGGVLPF